MRLLSFADDGTPILSEFMGNSVPSYAILSHTWTDEEVSYADVINGVGQQKHGYQKIGFCGRQALRDGLRYFWIDSCCIDRSSSAELSEAVNSQFQWYQNATICYVFLSDVSVSTKSEASGPGWLSLFYRSRWFTRGWTLPELLAPSSVVFFSREGNLLGDKRSLGKAIRDITGIPTEALLGKQLSKFSISERFSWAANRSTTRVEDEVYSLLGILGVHMPLIYGEGKEHAFNRLQEQIDRQLYDLKMAIHQTATLDKTKGAEIEADRSLPWDNDARGTQIVDHVTDSGYGGSGASKIHSYGVKLGDAPYETLVATIPESEAQSTGLETRTMYSDTASLRDPKLLEYVKAFADELYKSLPSAFDKTEFERVLPVLDEFLGAFAVKLCCEDDTPEHRNLMYLVHRYRSQITENLRQRYEEDSSQQNMSNSTSDDGMTVEDKMSILWKDEEHDSDSHGALDDGPDNIPDDDIEVDETQLPDLDKYTEIIKQTSAYQWLLWRIAVADRLECPGPFNAQKTIRDEILNKLGLEKRFSRGKPPRVHIDYYFRLDLFVFHTEQRYSCKVEQVLEQAITITGQGNDVQAATCLQYVEQTWGETGVRLLHLLQQAVLDPLRTVSFPTRGKQKLNMAVELSASAYYGDGNFIVYASGIPYSVAEVGEILAWFTASLRSSPSNQEVSSCTPVASLSFARSTRAPDAQTGNASAAGICTIEVDRFQTLKKSASDGSLGNCWLDSFRNPVVVAGYPILRRAQAGSGLEVSIDIMASVANASYLVDFCGRTFLKGFSTMLAVTEVIGSTVFWHFFYNADGTYISYEDVRVPRIQEDEASQTLDKETLATSRHILGWCEKVSCLAGTRDANYNIGWSKLRRPHSAFAFDKVSITAGKYLNFGTTMSIGIKDKPAHVSYDDDYLSTLEMISQRYFVFYDTADRRTWLLDGASALLHLLRAFIKYSQTKSRLKDFFVFEDEELEVDETRQGGDAAFQVLANEYNQLLPLWRKAVPPVEETTMKFSGKPEEQVKYQKAYFCLKDRVSQICRVLQQITAHQDNVYSQDGVGARIKLTPRRQLEGFDFMDVATDQGTLWPRVNYTHALGEGWVDFTRELHCVALFGTGFGNLMKPVGDSCRLCMSNITHEPDLLAITADDLLNIIEKKGDTTRSPWRVVENIYWYVPDKLFEPCQCDFARGSRRDRVQVFVPATHPKLWGKGLQGHRLVAGGAILVGHSFKYPLRWGNRIEPEEGEPEESIEITTTLHDDSGIGSSRVSESAEEPRTIRQLQWGRSPSDRPNPHDGGSSDSAIFLHANRQFVHSESSSRRGKRNAEASMLSRSSSAASRGTDSGAGGNGERSELASNTAASQDRQSDSVRSRSTGNFSEVWYSMGKRK